MIKTLGVFEIHWIKLFKVFQISNIFIDQLQILKTKTLFSFLLFSI